MKQAFAMLTVLAVGVSMSGCARISTQVVDKPRVDQELPGEQGGIGGNRGYLKGNAPAAAPRKKTRQMFQTDVEMATRAEMNAFRLNKKQPAAAVQQQASAPKPAAQPVPPAAKPQTDWEEETLPPVVRKPA